MIKITSKWKFTIYLAITLFLWSFSCANYALFQGHSKGEGFKLLYFIITLLSAGLIFFLGAFDIQLEGKKKRIAEIAAYVLSLVGAMNVSILFCDGFWGGVFLYIVNIFFYAVFAGIGLLVSGSMTVSAIVALTVSFVYNCISFIVYSFRGSSLAPTDFMAFSTALNVASQYKFKLRYQLITATLVAIVHLMTALKFRLNFEFEIRRGKLRFYGLCGALLFALGAVGMNYDRYDVSVFDQHDANFKHGSAVAFYVNATKMGLKAAEGYSPQTVDERLLLYDRTETQITKKPNIIVIMNESFADLKAVGDFETNIDYMPFYNSLKKNTIKGEVLVSPFGGYTCNSEYEFLTGMNTGLLSSQSIPYMHMIKKKMPYTLNTHLKQMGYSVTAMHPYYANNWNRPLVYEYMGFDKFISIHDYNKLNKNEFIRHYMSDYSNYQTVLKHLYNKDSRERKFIFNITMQNHGGYEYEDFDYNVRIKGMEGVYPQTEQYLTCLNYSDMALEALITELKKFNEPVVVALFGDHQPSVEEEFYEMLYGADLDDLSDEELSKRYITPFMIWANYDIKEAEGVKTSPSFLSNLIMEVAKLPKSRVQLYIDDLTGEVAQLNPLGYYDNDGVWHKHEDCPELEHYYNIQYSLLQGENLNYDFVVYDRDYDVLGSYVLSPKYLFKDESDAIIADYNTK